MMMLPVEPQTFGEMKARFHLAIDTPVDVADIIAGKCERPSSKREHVFDFEDGMRLIVSRDSYLGKTCLHVSASGNEEYGRSIKDEGIEGFLSDIILRTTGFLGKPPGNQIEAQVSERGVVHLMFEEGK